MGPWSPRATDIFTKVNSVVEVACVPGAGFEPARPFRQTLLRRRCLPVPSSRHGSGPGPSSHARPVAERDESRLPRHGTLVGMSQNPLRVVIAEDEALIRLDLKEMLEEE